MMRILASIRSSLKGRCHIMSSVCGVIADVSTSSISSSQGLHNVDNLKYAVGVEGADC